MVTVPGSIADARATRRTLQAAGRPKATSAPGTLDEFAAAYFITKAPVLAPDTIRNRDEDYCARIAPVLGRLLLTEITRERVETWLADLVQRAASRRMVVQTVATLRVILGAAVAWDRIPANPAARLTLPAPDTEREQAVERVLDADQLRRLFAAAGALRTETMLRAAGEAGLRRGEIAGLRWPDVDLVERRLSIRRSVVQERASVAAPLKKIEKTTKGRRMRRVAITTSFAERLGDWYAEAVVAGGASADGYVWPGRGGGPMHDRTLARAVERAAIRAGLVADMKGRSRPLITPHGLRHTCASILLANGVPLIVVSRQLGHANPNITATIYAHLLGDSQLDEAAAPFELDAGPDTRRRGRVRRARADGPTGA